MEIDNWKIAAKKRNEFLKEVIHPLLPFSSFSSTIQWGTFKNPSNTFHSILSTKNLFKGSIYELKYNKPLIHFTSLQSLSSILNDGFFRMSQLGELDDVNELGYASRVFEKNSIFDHNKHLIDKSKSQLFCLSACLKTKSVLKDLYMWENYADNGNGVMIEFNISDRNAHRFNIGQIKYGDYELQHIKALKKRAEEFYINKKTFPNNPIELFSIFKSFHKSSRFKKEKEVRILYASSEFNPKEPFEANSFEKPITMYQDINRKNQVIYFNKIFLAGKSPFPNSDTSIFPEITIKSVTLGYNFDFNEIIELGKYFNNIQGYNFKIYQLDYELNLINLMPFFKKLN